MILLILGCIWTVYGLLGLWGVQFISSTYRHRSWTRKYIQCRGAAWLTMGITWLSMYGLSHFVTLPRIVLVVTLGVVTAAVTVYSFYISKKFKSMLSVDYE